MSNVNNPLKAKRKAKQKLEATRAELWHRPGESHPHVEVYNWPGGVQVEVQTYVKIPVLFVTRLDRKHVYVWCWWCAKEHVHGRGGEANLILGHRVAHCQPGGPCDERGYIIRMPRTPGNNRTAMPPISCGDTYSRGILLYMMGSRIRELRTARGLTQEELAARAGLSRIFIAKLEGGERNNCSLRTLTGLAKAFEIPVTKLVAELTK